MNFQMVFSVNIPNSVAALFVILMIAFVGVFFAMGMVFDDDPDGYKLDREYDLHGTVDGKEVTGTGVAKYLEEGSSAHIYRFTFTVGDKEYISDLIFDSPGDVPLEKFYNHVGTVEGKEIWTNGLIESPLWTYTVSDKCRVVQVTLVGEGIDITGDLRSS